MSTNHISCPCIILSLLIRHQSHCDPMDMHEWSTTGSTILARKDARIHIPARLVSVVHRVGAGLSPVPVRRSQHQRMEYSLRDGHSAGRRRDSVRGASAHWQRQRRTREDEADRTCASGNEESLGFDHDITIQRFIAEAKTLSQSLHSTQRAAIVYFPQTSEKAQETPAFGSTWFSSVGKQSCSRHWPPMLI